MNEITRKRLKILNHWFLANSPSSANRFKYRFTSV
jgi:hypothetical protein